MNLRIKSSKAFSLADANTIEELINKVRKNNRDKKVEKRNAQEGASLNSTMVQMNGKNSVYKDFTSKRDSIENLNRTSGAKPHSYEFL